MDESLDRQGLVIDGVAPWIKPKVPFLRLMRVARTQHSGTLTRRDQLFWSLVVGGLHDVGSRLAASYFYEMDIIVGAWVYI